MLIQSIHMFSCGESISSAGIHLFREFLRTEFSDENIEFWLICEDFRNSCGSKKLQSKAQKIFNEFVAVQSKREVNLDSTTRIQLEKELESVTRNTFDQSQKRIQALMEKDSYCRFLRSDLYTAALDYCRGPSGNPTSPTEQRSTGAELHVNQISFLQFQVTAGYKPESTISGLLPNVKSCKELATASNQHETGSVSAPSSPKPSQKDQLISTCTVENEKL
ncbi:RGS8 [Fasciolopsis buskii]|uniref:RGS8 n=1 Tax=Fasciolopsis buskii TaxID=27845 RepID=A0A8E0VJ77_9TREM|nr:RGS8 [Fasciolopsis buski]